LKNTPLSLTGSPASGASIFFRKKTEQKKLHPANSHN
jgi:hypothetical protein